VPGLGDVRRKALLRHFGSLKRIRAATPEEIEAVGGIGPALAAAIAAELAQQVPEEPAVNLMTGEVLDPAVARDPVTANPGGLASGDGGGV
jgi:excinuclease ABC subunit C